MTESRLTEKQLNGEACIKCARPFVPGLQHQIIGEDTVEHGTELFGEIPKHTYGRKQWQCFPRCIRVQAWMETATEDFG